MLFDEGKEDILEYFDLSTAKRPALQQEKIDKDSFKIVALGILKKIIVMEEE
jgi:hypothetical protein